MHLRIGLRLFDRIRRTRRIAEEQRLSAVDDTVRLYSRLAALRRQPKAPVVLRYSGAALRAAAREGPGTRLSRRVYPDS
jgi:hypothetical protein